MANVCLQIYIFKLNSVLPKNCFSMDRKYNPCDCQIRK